jgi:hypothetical protein
VSPGFTKKARFFMCLTIIIIPSDEGCPYCFAVGILSLSQLCFMGKTTNPLSRKKFLAWGISISSLFALPAFLRSSSKKTEKKTVKMLTQDGRLVIVEADAIPQKKKKINPEDIHTWVTSKKSIL